MFARVQNDGEFSDPFPVTNGEARLCTSFNTVQHDVFCHAYFKLHKAFSKFYRRHSALLEKYSVGLKTPATRYIGTQILR